MFTRLKLLGKRKPPSKAKPKTEALGWANLTPPERRPQEREKKLGLPRFHTTAGDHLERGRGEVLGRERVRLRNAFTPAQPVVHARMFAGRTQLLESMIRSVEDQRLHLVIFGERGVGKTSLMHMLSLAAAEARYIVVYLSCGATSDFSETFRTVASEVPLLYHSGVSPISSTSAVGTSLADLLGTGKLTARQFSEAAAKLVGTRVIIFLDEFDRAESPEFKRDVAELIKTLSDMSARVQLVIAGVASDLVDLMEHIPSIRRSVSALRISAMSEVEVRELVANGERSSGVTFKKAATDLVIAASVGSPYLANLVCHLAGLRALDSGRVQIEVEDVAAAVGDAMEDFRRRLPGDITPRLDVIAEMVGRASPESRKSGSGDPPSLVSAVLTALEGSGLLEKSQPSRYALITDSLVPYLQLKQAHDRFNGAPEQRIKAAN